MIRPHWGVLAMLVTVATGCKTAHRTAPEPASPSRMDPLQAASRMCPARGAPDARPFDAAEWPRLEGWFRLELVDTSAGDWAHEPLILHLERADSAHAWRRDMRGLHFRPLIGTAGPTVADTSFANKAEVKGASLVTGCIDCLHPSWTAHSIRGASSEGFWGTWSSYADMVIIVDKQGRTYEPAGVFCASRQPESVSGQR